MNVRLMHRETDFTAGGAAPADLFLDLGLSRVVEVMAAGDTTVEGACRAALSASLADASAIRYRQSVLADFLERPQLASRLYDLASEAVAAERREFLGTFAKSPELVLSRSLRLITRYADVLERLHAELAGPLEESSSEGLSRLGQLLRAEAGPDRLQDIRQRLAELAFTQGVTMGVRLGDGMQGEDYVLKSPPPDERAWLARLIRRPPDGFHFEIPERDESGLRLIAELRGRGLSQAAGAVQAAAADMLDFFRQLQVESAFYVGCINLHGALARAGVTATMPVADPGRLALSATGLVDPVLALTSETPVVGNDLAADGARLVVISGPNRGGKSTFLRSVGLAQVFMMSGLFVTAKAYRASLTPAVFTHFPRREEEGMERGRLADELARLSDIVDGLSPGCLLLMSESFASTNEEEGAAIASEVLAAMADAGVRVVFVTHLLELAAALSGQDGVTTLRAERIADGRRTYRMVPGAAEMTSHARDIFEQIFGASSNT